MADAAPTTRIVVTTNPVGVGQSIISGAGTNSNLGKAAFDIASISANGPIPARKLDGPNPAGVNTIYRFPSDTPPYYMMLPINTYSRKSWASVGDLTEEMRIILPLPQQMIDNHNVRYDISDIGWTGGAGFEFVEGNKSQAFSLLAAGIIANQAKQGANVLGELGAGGKKAFNGALGAAGYAVNDFMTVMLKGPDYKKRDFIWRFSPSSAQETSDLRRIIAAINNSMAPSFAPIGSTFFRWPKIWKPEFVYQGMPQLLSLQTFKMKASVLTDASFNYTPNGNFSPFARTKAPTSVEMHLTFLELEFWLAGDFNDDGNIHNADGTLTDPHDASFSLLNNPGGTPGIDRPI